MPQFQETISHSTSIETALLYCYGAIEQLDWQVSSAQGNIIIAQTSRKWRSGQELVITVEEHTISVKSIMVFNEAFDLLSVNKKNVRKFKAAFEAIPSASNETALNNWKAGLQYNQAETTIALEQQKVEEEEMKAIMQGQEGQNWVTYSLIAINVLVFVLMVMNGVHIFEPDSLSLVNWGANYGPATVSGEWYRLFTSCFIHIGVIHLALNMYALLMIGQFLESLIGKTRFLTAYICTGILASLVSLWWHNGDIVSAGASGAIFGMYGLFLALLTTNLIPAQKRMALLQSIGIFICYNIFYGLKSTGIDNAAHIGGMVSGFLIGYAYFPTLKAQRKVQLFATYIVVIAATLVLSSFYLFNKKDDRLKYEKEIDKVLVLQDKALQPLKDLQNPNMLKEVSTISQRSWEEAQEIMKATASYTLYEPLVTHRKLMQEYVNLRVDQTNLIVIQLQGNENVEGEINALTEKINALVEALQSPK